jgi:hypothetical protein
VSKLINRSNFKLINFFRHRRARAYEAREELELCLEDVTAVAILEGFQNNNSLVFADKILKDLGLKHAKEAMEVKEPGLRRITMNYAMKLKLFLSF